MRRLALLLSALAVAPVARAEDEAMPPWVEAGDVPIPGWARSVSPSKIDAAIYAEPGNLRARRGSAQLGARLPLFAAKRGPGCQGRWLEVGPVAWMCSDVADFSADGPVSAALGTRMWSGAGGVDLIRPPRPGARPLPKLDFAFPTDDGLPYRYFFAGQDGAYGFSNLASALDDAPDQELEKGFAIAAVEEKTAHGEAWVKTRKGRWFATRELVPVRSFLFHGEILEPERSLDLAWVVADRAQVFATEKADKATGVRVRFEKLHVYDEKPGLAVPQATQPAGSTLAAGKQGAGGMLRISEDGQPPVWIRARDVGRARVAQPPAEAHATERWIDVDLAQQTLVAYEGTRPVFATLVSTGRGPKGSGAETRLGVHRIWVKIFTTKMDNLDNEDAPNHYAIEDVPWVQFFDNAIALHGAFWHHDFGHVHSHGCVNLAPLDARWLFAFTGPHLPQGWVAVFPTEMEPGTLVRVR